MQNIAEQFHSFIFVNLLSAPGLQVYLVYKISYVSLHWYIGDYFEKFHLFLVSDMIKQKSSCFWSDKNES